ncbi:MAG TPA: VOC family protein [Thermoplasmata archaeon]|nr:VOC family protein [Thermoplasmata archaeon]
MANESAVSVPRLYRTILSVSNVERAGRFYGELLGTVGRLVGPGRMYFDCGPVILALVASAPEGPAPSRSFDSVYFATGALEAVYRRAKDLGCLLGGNLHDRADQPMGAIVVRPWGERSFYVMDPFGNPLCFVDETTVFTGKSPGP